MGCERDSTLISQFLRKLWIEKGLSQNTLRSYEYDLKSLTKYATGCCFCMRYNDFKEIGGFDENFPMYSEDVDLSLTIRKQGNEVWYIPESIIWHKVSASIGGSFSLSKKYEKNKRIILTL